MSATSLSEQERDALNKHGVFFKKRVLHALQEISGIQILSEELGVSFGGTRVIDILALDGRDKTRLLFVFECKRAYTVDRRWIFFRDVDQRYRVVRVRSGLTRHSSVFTRTEPPHPPVCSEGYDIRKGEAKADQNPIFQAGAQLSGGLLGLIARRDKELQRAGNVAPDFLERYVPVLVTNAELCVVQHDLKGVSLDTGNMPTIPSATSADFVILKHPFPTPEGLEHDFREIQNPAPEPRDWSQLSKESIYVVRAVALAKFMAPDHRDYLRTVDSEN